MGMVVPMTPTESLIKNGVMILLIILQFYLKDDFVPNWIFQLQKLKWSLFIIAFLCPFLINGVDFRKDVLRQRLSENINKDVLKVVESSTQNGNEILLYLSPNCVFCKMQAKKWMWFKKRNHWNVRVHVVFMGVNINDEIKQFLTETSLEYDQYEVMPPKEFIHLTQGLLPSIYLVRNDQIIQKDNFISFNEQNLRGQLSR
jgi:thioredoxin-related protein